MGSITLGFIPTGVALIYFLERHPRYGQSVEIIFRRIETGDLQGLMSSLVFAELLIPLYRAGDIHAANGLIRLLKNFRHLEILDLTPEIGAEAARLRAAYNLRTPDAVHAATALTGQANGVLTNDKNLGRLQAEGLQIWLFDSLSYHLTCSGFQRAFIVTFPILSFYPP